MVEWEEVDNNNWRLTFSPLVCADIQFLPNAFKITYAIYLGGSGDSSSIITTSLHEAKKQAELLLIREVEEATQSLSDLERTK